MGNTLTSKKRTGRIRKILIYIRDGGGPEIV